MSSAVLDTITRNRLQGRIVAIRPGSVRCEIEIAVGDGLVCAQHSAAQVRRRGWCIGQRVWLVIPGTAIAVIDKQQGRPI